MHTEHKTFNSSSFDDITSAVSARLEAGRELLHDAPPAACDGMNAILDDATAKLEHLQNLSMKFDWPEKATTPNAPANPQAFDDLVTNLQQAEAMLSAIVDQACLNGPDAVKPAALIAAHNLTHQAATALDTIKVGGAQS